MVIVGWIGAGIKFGVELAQACPGPTTVLCLSSLNSSLGTQAAFQ